MLFPPEIMYEILKYLPTNKLSTLNDPISQDIFNSRMKKIKRDINNEIKSIGYKIEYLPPVGYSSSSYCSIRSKNNNYVKYRYHNQLAKTARYYRSDIFISCYTSEYNSERFLFK